MAEHELSPGCAQSYHHASTRCATALHFTYRSLTG
jgi:hypothetical protein